MGRPHPSFKQYHRHEGTINFEDEEELSNMGLVSQVSIGTNQINDSIRSTSPDPLRIVDFDPESQRLSTPSVSLPKTKSSEKIIRRALSRMSHESKFRLNVASNLPQQFEGP